ncbi:MAG: CHAT domain-containing protein [Flavobacteriales bacterium]|nr:CHAT domain-containing protein [Flavobacteriales bacterium]
MNTGQRCIAAAALCFGPFATAQVTPDPLALRDSLIWDLYENESHGPLLRAVDQQVIEAKGTTWEDSLFQYTYPYARAAWKLNGVEAGMSAASGFVERIRGIDENPEHVLEAMGDQSWLYYEVGLIEECFKVDSSALVIADRPGVSTMARGRARQYVAFDLAQLGNHAAAARYFLDARGIYLNGDSSLRMNLAESCNGVGSSYWHLGRNREAERFYLESLKWLGDSEESEMLVRKASAIGNLALLWEDAGDLDKSKLYLERNIALNTKVIERTKDPTLRDEAILTRSRSYANMAAMYHSLGDMATARNLLDRATSDRSGVLEQNDVKLLFLKESYADLERAGGNLEKADTLLQEYVDACMQHYGIASSYTTLALTKQAGVAASLGQLHRADSLFDRTIRAQLGMKGSEVAPVLADTYLARAQFRTDQHRYPEALEDLTKARTIYADIHGGMDRHVAQCELAMARAEFAQGRIDQADLLINAALSKLQDRIPADTGMLIPRSELAPHLLPEVLYQKVRMDRSRRLATTGDLHELERAIRAVARNKNALRDEDSRLLLLGAQKQVFDLAQDIAFELHQQDGDRAWLEKLFALSEENRSILLKQRLNTFASLSYAGVPDSTLEQENMLLKQLEQDEDHVLDANTLLANERAYAAFLGQLQRDHPNYFALRYGDRTYAIADVQRELLGPERSLVAYSMTEGSIHIVVITQDRAEVVQVADPGVGRLVLDLDRAVVDREMEHYIERAREVHRIVWEPVAHLLTTPEVIIIPDEELFRLNFEVLLSRDCEVKDHKDHLLIREHTISYLLSATTALQFKALDRPHGKGSLAIAPGFSDALKQEYLAAIPDNGPRDQAYLDHIQQPFAVITAKELGKLFAARVMVGGDATETSFRSEAGRYGIIHLGTHAEVNNSSPLYSKLILSKSGLDSTTSSDGYLHAYELYQMELSAELAVLTACETGAGQRHSSEGVRSLAHGFAYAGCPSLVMSLWKIDEKTSASIISDFYHELADGQAKNKALRAAKLAYLDAAEGEEAMPYYWAGLVLVGDVAPVSDPGGGSFAWILVVLGLLAAAMAIMLARRSGRKSAA